MQRDLLGGNRAGNEFKGHKRLKGNTYRQDKMERMLAEEFFATLLEWDITVFTTIMEQPFLTPQRYDNRLGKRYSLLLQRIEVLASERGQQVEVKIDGLGNRFKKLARQFSDYLSQSSEGRAMTHITRYPQFVDSKLEVGIQIADMCAYVVRTHQENRLFAGTPWHSDEYLHAVSRWYRVIWRMTRDFPMNDGKVRYGLHRLPVGIR